MNKESSVYNWQRYTIHSENKNICYKWTSYSQIFKFNINEQIVKNYQVNKKLLEIFDIYPFKNSMRRGDVFYLEQKEDRFFYFYTGQTLIAPEFINGTLLVPREFLVVNEFAPDFFHYVCDSYFIYSDFSQLEILAIRRIDSVNIFILEDRNYNSIALISDLNIDYINDYIKDKGSKLYNYQWLGVEILPNKGYISDYINIRGIKRNVIYLTNNTPCLLKTISKNLKLNSYQSENYDNKNVQEQSLENRMKTMNLSQIPTKEYKISQFYDQSSIDSDSEVSLNSKLQYNSDSNCKPKTPEIKTNIIVNKNILSSMNYDIHSV